MGRLASGIILLTGWRRALVTFLAGAFAVLVQAPYDFPAAGFVSFAVLVWLLDGGAAAQTPGLLGRLKPAFATGWLFGFGYFIAGLWWTSSAMLVEADTYAWAIPFAIVGLPLLLAPFYGLATMLARLLWNDGIGRIFALAFGFGLAEWLRTFVLTGFPWNPIGFGAMPTPLLMQSAEIVGTAGMNGLAVLVFAMPALLGTGRGKALGMTIATALALIHVGYGVWSLAQVTPVSSETTAFRVVQPNIEMTDKWTKPDDIFKTLLSMSAQPPGEGQPRPDVIVWPETSVPYFLNEAPAALAAIGEMLQPGQQLVAGAVRQEDANPGPARYYNSVIQIDDAGQIVDAVDKNHLVPFGEYLPLQEIFALAGLKQLVSGPSAYEPGKARHALQLKRVFVTPYICYEMIFPDLMPPMGSPASHILTVTNDAWFGRTPGPYQHLRQAQVRAVESKNYVIRSANTGISAIIDPRGRLLDALALGSPGVIDAQIPMPNQSRFPLGDGRRNGLVLLGLLFLLASIFRLSKTI